MNRIRNMVDKPPPPRRTGALPPRYDYEEHSITQVNSGTVSSVSNAVLSAFKVNPILIGMILLLLTILGAFGWYAMRNDDRIYSYIAARDQQQADLWDRLVAMAKECRDKVRDKEAYPSLEFPQIITKPAPTPGKRDGK